MATKTKHDLLIEKIRSRYETPKSNIDKPEENKEELNWFDKIMQFQYALSNGLVKGLGQSFEGIVDFGANILGAGAELFGANDFSKGVNDFITRDFTTEFMKSDLYTGSQVLSSGIYGWANADKVKQMHYDAVDGQGYYNVFGEGEKLPEILQSLTDVAGSVLGSVATASVGGSIGKAGSALSKIGQTAGIITSAGGQSSEQSIQQGASSGEALAYGTLRGVTEATLEKFTGDALGKIFSKVGKTVNTGGKLAGVLGKTTIDNTAVRVIKNFTEEGLEEVLSDVLDPITKAITYDDRSVEQIWNEEITVEGLLETFIYSGLMGGLIEGGNTIKGANQYGSLKAYNFSTAVESIMEINEQAEKALKDGKIEEYEELMEVRDYQKERIAKKYQQFIEDVKANKVDIKAIMEDMAKNGIIPDKQQAVQINRQTALEQFEVEKIRDIRQSASQSIVDLGVGKKVDVKIGEVESLGNGKYRKIKGSYYDEKTGRIVLKSSQIMYNKIAEVLGHEMKHVLESKELTDTLLEDLSETEYKRLYNDYFKAYSQVADFSQLSEEAQQEYIRQEISADILGSMFDNLGQMERAFKKMDAKGLTRLMYNVRSLFESNRRRFKNYNKVMEALEKARNNYIEKHGAETTEIESGESDPRYKLDTVDSEGNILTEEQLEFFNDTKVVDKNGKLLVVYHGAMKPGFTVFDNQKVRPNPKFKGRNVNFFMLNKYIAADYTESKYPIPIRYSDSESFYNVDGRYKPNVYPVYLNIKNPLVIDAKGSHWNEIHSDIPGTERLRSSDDFVAWAIEQGGYDGVIIKNVIDGTNTMFEMETPSDEYITIESPNQVKHIDNKNPTLNDDIRYKLDLNENFEDDFLYDDDYVEEINALMEHFGVESFDIISNPIDLTDETAVEDFISCLRKTSELSNRALKNKIQIANIFSIAKANTVSETTTIQELNEFLEKYKGKNIKKFVEDFNTEMENLFEINSIDTEIFKMQCSVISDNNIMLEFIYNGESLCSINREIHNEYSLFYARSNFLGEVSDFISDNVSSLNDNKIKEYVDEYLRIKKINRYGENGRLHAEYSEETDSLGNQLPKAVADFNKKNKMRTKEGKLVVAYHGSANAGFTIFDPNYDVDDKGHYRFKGSVVNFTTDNPYMANTYTTQTNDDEIKIREVYNDDVLSISEKLINEYVLDGVPNIELIPNKEGFLKIKVSDEIYDMYQKYIREGWDDESFIIDDDKILFIKEDYIFKDEGMFRSSFSIKEICSTYVIGDIFNIYEELGVNVNLNVNSIKFELDSLNTFLDQNFGQLYEVYPYAENPLEVDAKGSRWNKIQFDFETETRIISESDFELMISKFKKQIPLERLSSKTELKKLINDIDEGKLDIITKKYDFKLSTDIDIDFEAIILKFNFKNNETGKVIDIERMISDWNCEPEITTKEGYDKFINFIGTSFGITGYGFTTTNDIVEYAQEKGYDGVIIRNVIDYSFGKDISGEYKPSDLYITIRNSNQIKSTSNLKPTKNPDFRYKLDSNSDEYVSEEYALGTDEYGSKRLVERAENPRYSLDNATNDNGTSKLNLTTEYKDIGFSFETKIGSKLFKIEGLSAYRKIAENYKKNFIPKAQAVGLKKHVSALREYLDALKENKNATAKEIERALNYAYNVEQFIKENFPNITTEFPDVFDGFNIKLNTYYSANSVLVKKYNELVTPKTVETTSQTTQTETAKVEEVKQEVVEPQKRTTKQQEQFNKLVNEVNEQYKHTLKQFAGIDDNTDLSEIFNEKELKAIKKTLKLMVIGRHVSGIETGGLEFVIENINNTRVSLGKYYNSVVNILSGLENFVEIIKDKAETYKKELNLDKIKQCLQLINNIFDINVKLEDIIIVKNNGFADKTIFTDEIELALEEKRITKKDVEKGLHIRKLRIQDTENIKDAIESLNELFKETINKIEQNDITAIENTLFAKQVAQRKVVQTVDNSDKRSEKELKRLRKIISERKQLYYFIEGAVGIFEEEQFKKIEYLESLGDEKVSKEITSKDITVRDMVYNSPVYLNMSLKDVEVYVGILTYKIKSTDDLSLEEIMSLPSIVSAETYNDTQKDKMILEKDAEPTPEQLEMFGKVLEKFLKGKAKTAEDGTEYYPDDYETKTNGRVAEIIIGLPASGKSTAIADELKTQLNAFELDNDTIKGLLPEFKGGKGANNCQGASSYISDEMALPILLERGTNLVNPIVGKSEESIQEKIDLLTNAGYDIRIRFVDLPKKKALIRALSRFYGSGRYVSLNYLNGISVEAIEANYEHFKKTKEISEYGRYNNDVARGEKVKSVDDSKTKIQREHKISKQDSGNNLPEQNGQGLHDGSGSVSEESESSSIRSGNVESQGVETTETVEQEQPQTTETVEQTTEEQTETHAETDEVDTESTYSVKTVSNKAKIKKEVAVQIRSVIIKNTRYKSPKDNVKTLKWGAHLYNKKVYDKINDAKALRERIAKYLHKERSQPFVVEGKGAEMLEYEITAVLNSLDRNLSVEKKIDAIYKLVEKHITKPSKAIEKAIKKFIKNTIENGGEKSRMVKLIESASEHAKKRYAEECEKEVKDAYERLQQALDMVEVYQETINDLNQQLEAIKTDSEANATENKKKINQLSKIINSLTAECKKLLETKNKNDVKVKELKQSLKELKSQLKTKTSEVNKLTKKLKQTSTSKTTISTSLHGKKVINHEFRKGLDAIDFSELADDGFTIEKKQVDNDLYNQIAHRISVGDFDGAVEKYLKFVGELKVTDADGNVTKLDDGSQEWKEFAKQIEQFFKDFYFEAETSTAQELKDKAKHKEALMKGVVSLIKSSYAIKNKIKKNKGVVQTISAVASNLVKGIAKPSITNLKNGSYRAVIKEAYEQLTKKVNGKTILEDIGYEFEQDVLDMMNEIGNGKGELKVEEIQKLTKVMRYMSKFLTKSAGGKVHDGMTDRQRAIESIKKQKSLGEHQRWVSFLQALSPRVVFKYMDQFEDGINTYIYNKLLDGESVEQKTFVKLFGIMKDFYKTSEGKQIKKNINKKVTIQYKSGNETKTVTATVGEFVSIWKLLQREDSRAHIANSGFTTADKKGRLTEFRFNAESLKSFKEALDGHFEFSKPNSIYGKYITKTTEFFEMARDLKIMTDESRLGYSNVLENEEYFPIKVVAHDRLMQLGENTDYMRTSMQGSRNYSWNASVEGLKGMLEISSVEQVIQIYSTQMARYVGYAEIIDTINTIFNYQIQGDDVENGLYKGETLRNVMGKRFGAKNGKSNALGYYNKLLKDVQGIRTADDGILERIRGRFALYQLGANLKVMANQLSALPTAIRYLGLGNYLKAHKTLLAGGFGVKVEEMPYTAQYRIMEKTMIDAQTLTDKGRKVAEWFGKGMTFTDNLVIKTIWTACMMQTNNNKTEATELFDKIIRETQGFNTLQRSGLLRSDNSLIKQMMMFTIQPSHNLSNIMEYALHAFYSKKTGAKITGEQRSVYIKSIVGIALEGAMYTAISLLFKYLLDKDEEDEYEIENILESYFNDNIIGMIPFLNNIEVDFQTKNGKFIQFNDFNLGAISQVYEAFEEVQNVFTAEDPLSSFKSLMYSIGMLTGIPTRNLNNYGTMILKSFAPDFAYEWEIRSNGKSLYNKEIVNTALDKRQMKKAWNYYKAYNNNIVELDDETMKFMFNMYSCGYTGAYIKQIPTILDTEDETIVVDREKFVKTYSQVSMALKKLVSNPSFLKLSDLKKEKMIKKIVNYYYQLAYKEQSGEKLTNIEHLIKEEYLSVKTLVYLNEIANIEETDKMTRKEAIQKYINKLPISRQEKFVLYFLAGYKLPEDKQRLVKNFLKLKGISKQTLNAMF